MSGFSEAELRAELERRRAAIQSLTAASRAALQTRSPHLSGAECVHCHQALSVSDRPPLCESCLGD